MVEASKNKALVVTGAFSGIGSKIALTFMRVRAGVSSGSVSGRSNAAITASFGTEDGDTCGL